MKSEISKDVSNVLDDKFEVNEQVCKIKYDLLNIDMFRDVYIKNINPFPTSFENFRLKFYASSDSIKFLILNFLAIQYIITIYPKVNCVINFKSSEIYQLNNTINDYSKVFINIKDVSNKIIYISTTGFKPESIKAILNNIYELFLENEKRDSYFKNELLILQLALKELIGINIYSEEGKKINDLNLFSVINFREIINSWNFLNETLINLIFKYLKKRDTFYFKNNHSNVNFIEWLLNKNDVYPTLNNILAEIYISRIDLINSFRQGEKDWFKKVFSWFIEYGWKEIGIDKLFDNGEVQKLLNNCLPMEINQHEGTSVISYFGTVKGLGEAAKNYGKVIELLNPKINYADIVSIQDVDRKSFTYSDLNILGANGDQLSNFFNNLGFSNGFPTKSIAIWFWELEKLTPNFQQGIKYVDKIWASTKFNYETFKTSITLPIDYVPMPILKTFEFTKTNVIQGKYFINIFDFLSDFNRKNPLAAIDAFTMAFPVESEGPKLLIKSTNSVFDPENSILLASKISQRKDIIWIDEVLSEGEINYLLKNSIGLISLHRSEGFGINISNSMQLKVPTVVTAYSGNMDFCNEENSFLVDYSLVPVNTKNVNYAGMDCNWADPSISEAAKYLLEIYEGSKSVDKIVNTAIQNISKFYALDRIFNLMKKSIRKTKLNR